MDIDFSHCFWIKLDGLNKLRKFWCCNILDLHLHISKNRRYMSLVGTFIVIYRPFFQFHGSVIIKVPFGKLGKSHILIEGNVTFAMTLKFKSIFLCQFFALLSVTLGGGVNVVDLIICFPLRS